MERLLIDKVGAPCLLLHYIGPLGDHHDVLPHELLRPESRHRGSRRPFAQSLLLPHSGIDRGAKLCSVDGVNSPVRTE